MAGQRTSSSGNATYTFTYTANIARIDEIANGAARSIWIANNPNLPTTDYDSLSVQQKINILDLYISSHFTALATNNKLDTDVLAAEIAAQAYANTNYGL